MDNPKFEIPLRPPPKNTIKRSYIRQPGESQGSPIVKAVNERNPILGNSSFTIYIIIPMICGLPPVYYPIVYPKLFHIYRYYTQ